MVGRGGSVSTATRYGLEGLMIESRWAARFSAPVHFGPGAHPYTKGNESFPRVKRPGRGADHSPNLASRLKKGKRYTYNPHLDRRVAYSRLKFTLYFY